MKPIRFSSRALDDIGQIGRQIAEDRPLAALSFTELIRARCHRIALSPEGYALRPAYGPGVRAVVVDPYLVLYRVRPDRIVILSVRHGARRPVRFR